MFSLPFSPSTFRLDNGRNYLLVIRSPLCWKTSPSCSSRHSIHKNGSLTQKIHRCKLCPLLRSRKKDCCAFKSLKRKFCIDSVWKKQNYLLKWMSLWLDLVHWIRRRQNEKRYFNSTKWIILWHNRKKKTNLVAFLISFSFFRSNSFLEVFWKKERGRRIWRLQDLTCFDSSQVTRKKQFLKMDPDPEGKKRVFILATKGKIVL